VRRRKETVRVRELGWILNFDRMGLAAIRAMELFRYPTRELARERVRYWRESRVKCSIVRVETTTTYQEV